MNFLQVLGSLDVFKSDRYICDVTTGVSCLGSTSPHTGLCKVAPLLLDAQGALEMFLGAARTLLHTFGETYIFKTIASRFL